jgi:hypothetical protein
VVLDDESLPIINKTKHPKKREKNRYKKKRPKFWQIQKPPKKAHH